MSTQPPIRYAWPSEGVNIAFTVTGSGPTVIDMPSQPLSHQLLMRRFAAGAASLLGGVS